MMTTFTYATATEAAAATAELIGRAKNHTLDDDKALTANQAHGVVGFVLGMALGRPGETPPIRPIGAAVEPELSLEDAERMIQSVGLLDGGDAKLAVPPALIALALRVGLSFVLRHVSGPLGEALRKLLEAAR
jgi:hypothetical protein